MNGRGLIIAIIGVGISLGGLILNSQRSTHRAIAELREDVAGLRERMARLEGLFEGYLNREGE